ncbi:Vegetative incompatibility protein HET-E-1, partial [Pseudocercospora fuligena]
MDHGGQIHSPKAPTHELKSQKEYAISRPEDQGRPYQGMWLLNARTRQLESLNDEDAREQGYAILSHVWEKEEITFNDIHRWFTRGWTLQELIAPWKMRFYSKDWELVGDKHGLCPVLERITGIPRTILRNECLLNTVSVAKRMYWAAERETTRPEDIAYCLLGIFDVNIPLLYGEGGQKAFRRLQEAVMRSSTDHSILIWQPHHDLEASVLASSPSCYRYSSKVVQDASHVPDSYERNNAGIRINLPLVHWRDKHFVLLDCRYEDDFSVVSDQTLGSVLPSSPMERFLAERQAPTERLKETSFSGLIGLQVDIIRTASTGLTTVRRNQASRRGMFNFDVFSSDDGGQQLPAILTPLLIVRYDYTPNR